MICRVVLRILVIGYVAALAVLLIGTFGLFGQARDPLSGVYLIPLGLPWNLLVDWAPEPTWPWLTGLAPCINIALLRVLCRWSARRREAPE